MQDVIKEINKFLMKKSCWNVQVSGKFQYQAWWLDSTADLEKPVINDTTHFRDGSGFFSRKYQALKVINIERLAKAKWGNNLIYIP